MNTEQNWQAYFQANKQMWDEWATVHRTNYQWKHRMGEIVNAVAGAGLRIEYLHEFPYTFCDLYDWPQSGIEWRMAQDAEGWWRLTRVGDFIPLMFSLKACKGQ
jgi:hypothetical protein